MHKLCILYDIQLQFPPNLKDNHFEIFDLLKIPTQINSIHLLINEFV